MKLQARHNIFESLEVISKAVVDELDTPFGCCFYPFVGTVLHTSTRCKQGGLSATINCKYLVVKDPKLFDTTSNARSLKVLEQPASPWGSLDGFD